MTGDTPVPRAEVERRLAALQARLGEERLAAALLVQATDLYYFTGTAQDAHLVVPAAGEPALYVRRSLSRARRESPLDRVLPLASFRDLPPALGAAGVWGGMLGLELDVLPASRYLMYGRIFEGFELGDCSGIVRDLRSRKSPWELERVLGAAAILARGFEAVGETLVEGMTEIELAAEVERVLRRAGHQGTLRSRAFNAETHYGAILSGPSAAEPGASDAPIVGPGPNAAIGKGASHRAIRRNEPVVVDLVAGYEGYLADQTRTYSLGPVDPDIAAAYEQARSILSAVAAEARPGVTGAHLYDRACELAGDRDGFMGAVGEQAVSFVGHGIGLELDEPPFLARGWDHELDEGMVFALEPKFVFAGRGAVGVENSYAVVAGGAERLTAGSEQLIEL